MKQSSSGIPVWREIGATPTPAAARARDARPERRRLTVVGGGPIGLALALDLARRGHPVLVLNRLPFIAAGSKAICFSKRSLEIFDRLGIGERVREKGVQWERGKVFWRDDPVPLYEFDLLPVKDQRNPAFVNIQQYYVEEYLVDALAAFDQVELRWGHEVTAVTPRPGRGARLTVRAAGDTYEVETEWLAACDGSRSPVRHMLGLDFQGRVFEDNFLIADVRFAEERPPERWFHFDPPWPGWSSLVHKQPDGVWRLDFQLGWDIDREAAVRPENVEPFVRGLLGEDVEFEFEWLSVYTFQCRRMQRFVHDRVIFLGDAAHLVSPFGARGCNGGLQDVDDLGWKLHRVLSGTSPPRLLDSYDEEAITTADENILNSTRSTDFMTPKSPMAKVFRDAVLELARDHPFARPFINSGRLSQPVTYRKSSLNAVDSDPCDDGPMPGAPAIDAPVRSTAGEDWLLHHLGDEFVLLRFTGTDAAPSAAATAADDATAATEAQVLLAQGVRVLDVAPGGEPRPGRVVDARGLVRERYAAAPGTRYLIRPDQHVAGRWRHPGIDALLAAHRRACAVD